MNRVDYTTVTEKALKQIEQGAFLTVKCADKLNTMTIGWATIGIIWQKPILLVAVRPTRHTFGIIEQSNNFTVSVPYENMKEALMFCGTNSGRDCDKFRECNLSVIDAQKVATSIIRMHGLHFECRIVYKSAMDSSNLVEAYEKLYPKKDYHTLYFGEILDCYETE